jgi:two-component system response regulator CpxR
MKILIIEDDVLLARMYQKVFTYEHYEVEVARDGEQGLERARTARPSLILLDILMPGLNGLQVLDRLKHDGATKDIPVIILTNLAEEKNAEIALEKGAVHYIVKSQYKPKEVEQIVRDVLTGYPDVAVSSEKNL